MSNNNFDHENRNSHKSIVKATTLLSFGTLVSRFLGFLRDMILASVLGTGFMADAFFVANKIPNLMRSLVGEGASDSAVVPVFTEYVEKESKENFFKFVSVIITIATMVVLVVVVLGIILAPLIVLVMAPGFVVSGEKFRLTVVLTRIMFPYLVFVSLTAYFVGMLFSMRAFKAPAFNSCLLNVVTIFSALVSIIFKLPAVYCLAVGTVLGGAIQLVSQIAYARKEGFVYYTPKTLNHPGAVKILKLMAPRTLGSGIYQINIFVDTFCASLSGIVGAGGISAIYFANRLVQFPLGVFGVALASATLPALSSFVQMEKWDDFKKTVIFSLENTFFVLMPSTVFLMFFSEPIVRILFERGAFNIESTAVTSSALFFFSIGLFGYSSNKILVSAFYAFCDTKTPVKVAGICLAVNAILNVILMFPMKIAGIALASSVSATVNFVLLYSLLDKKLKGIKNGLKAYFIKVTCLSVLTGILMMFIWQKLSCTSELLKLIMVCVLWVIVYYCLGVIFKLEQVNKISGVIKSKIFGRRQG